MEAKNKATENRLFIHMLIQTFLNAMCYVPSMRIWREESQLYAGYGGENIKKHKTQSQI